MSGQEYDDDDLFGDSRRMTRTTSGQSVVSVESNHDEERQHPSIEESQSLLAGTNDQEHRDGADIQTNGTLTVDENMLDRALKRHLAPIKYEIKRLKQQVEIADKKLNTSMSQNEQLQKQVKELKTSLNKGTEDLSLLMTTEGVQRLRSMCLRNLDMKAKEEEENSLLQKFMDKAKEEGWMIKRTAKAERDITSKYRENRNYLKAQIRLRVHEDLSNQTGATASKLLKTVKFVREHLGVPDLSNDIRLIIYNFAYTTLKYSNKSMDESGMSQAEKTIKEKARKNLWQYVMERVDGDRKNKKEASGLKDRICRLLESGVKFEAYAK